MTSSRGQVNTYICLRLMEGADIYHRQSTAAPASR